MSEPHTSHDKARTTIVSAVRLKHTSCAGGGETTWLREHVPYHACVPKPGAKRTPGTKKSPATTAAALQRNFMVHVQKLRATKPRY